MPSLPFVVCCLSLLLGICFSNILDVKSHETLKIAFGSCNKFHQSENSDVFYSIANYEPDVFIWIGDVAYIDYMPFPLVWVATEDPAEVERKFNATKHDAPYKALREKTKIIGVWDDHDYGINNGNKYFPHKDMMKGLWLDFIDEPTDSPRRKRENDGIYTSYYLGANKRVKVILLDVRYSRDTYSEETQDMLGQNQWSWLENELRSNKAYLTLIGTGTQFLPDDRFIPEFWMPKSRNRLMELLKSTDTSGVIFFSGDPHYGELMMHPCAAADLGYDIFELCSSGLSHTMDQDIPFGEYLHKVIFPETYNKPGSRYIGINFGSFEVEWNERDLTKSRISLQLRDKDGREMLSKVISLKDLQINKNKRNDEAKSNCVVNQGRWRRLGSHILFNRLLKGDTFFIFILLLPFIFYFLIKGLLKEIKGFWDFCRGRKNRENNKKKKDKEK